MTELEGASRNVPNESGEMPTMNALASMVQSVVQEIKRNEPTNGSAEQAPLTSRTRTSTTKRANWSTEMLTENQLFLSIQRSAN